MQQARLSDSGIAHNVDDTNSIEVLPLGLQNGKLTASSDIGGQPARHSSIEASRMIAHRHELIGTLQSTLAFETKFTSQPSFNHPLYLPEHRFADHHSTWSKPLPSLGLDQGYRHSPRDV